MSELRHVGIVVSNLDRSLAFYAGALGLQEVARNDENGPFLDGLLGMTDARVTTVKLKGRNTPGQIELLAFESPDMQTAEKPLNACGVTHIALQVEDLDTIYQRLSKSGTPFNAAPAMSPDGGAKVAFCRDPDGTFLELVELQGAS